MSRGLRNLSLPARLIAIGAAGFVLTHAAGAYGLFAQQGHRQPSAPDMTGTAPLLLPLLIAAAALATFIGAFVLLRRARMFEDMPTSRIRSAAQGYIELQGRAQLMPGPAVLSPLSRQPCAWWSYTIHHYDASRRDWVKVESATSDCLFELADDTGICIVDPHGAEVVPGFTRSWRGRTLRPVIVPKKTEWIGFGNYRYREKMIRVGDELYATGLFRTQAAILELDETREVGELLTEWKRDQAELLGRFDANSDGRIDLQEWESVRRAAIRQVREQQVQQSLHPDIHVLTRPRDRRPFILSALSQHRLTQRYRIGAVLCLIASLLLAVLLIARALPQAGF